MSRGAIDRRDPFTKDFYPATTVYDDDSRPPTAETSKKDVRVGFSLGWQF